MTIDLSTIIALIAGAGGMGIIAWLLGWGRGKRDASALAESARRKANADRKRQEAEHECISRIEELRRAGDDDLADLAGEFLRRTFGGDYPGPSKD